MKGYNPYPIYDLKNGRVTARKPWLLPYDAYKETLNAYVERGVLKKRRGYEEFGRIVAFVDDEAVGTGDGETKTFAITLTKTPIQDIVLVTDGVESFTDNGDGTLTGDAGGVGTINLTGGTLSVTFHTAPTLSAEITADYNYYPGLPCMGIFEHFTGTDRKVVVFDTKRMNQYNASTSLLEDKTLSDTWTGGDDKFFHCCSATDNKLYITNGTNQIRTWDGSTLSDLVIDYTGGSSNKVDTCKMIFEYHGHIVILYPTEDGVAKPRRWRSSEAGTYTSWPSYCWGDAPTPDDIMGAQMIGNDLYVWFKESLWKLVYTGIYTSPFEWERITAEDGLYAQFSLLTVGGKSYGMSKSSILATDGIRLVPADDSIPGSIISDFDVGKLKYTYASRHRALRQIWWTMCSIGASYPDRVLAYDLEGGGFFTYDLPFHCFGSYATATTLTLDGIDDAWDDIDYAWDEDSSVAGYPLRLAGTYGGYIYQTNLGMTDNGSAIEFLAETGEWNPFILQGQDSVLGAVDFLVTRDDDTELLVEFFIDQESVAYLTQTLTFEDEEDRDRALVWKRLYVGCCASHHRIRLSHTASGQPVEIHAIIPWFKPDGEPL